MRKKHVEVGSLRKVVALSGAIALVLFTPAGAGAGQAKTKYAGAFNPSGTLSFVVKPTNNGKKVFRFAWQAFPLDCKGGPETSSNRLNFAVRVKDKRFHAEAVDDAANPRAFLTLDGKFEGGGTASGTMRIKGRRVPVDSGGRANCDSGKRGWSAARAPL